MGALFFYIMEEENKFIIMLKTKYPNMDIDKLICIFDNKINEVNAVDLNFPLDCDLNKHIFVSIIDEYLKNE